MANNNTECMGDGHQPNSTTLPLLNADSWGAAATGPAREELSPNDRNSDPFWIALQQHLREDREERRGQDGTNHLGAEADTHGHGQLPAHRDGQRSRSSLAPGTFRSLGLPEFSPSGFTSRSFGSDDMLADSLDPHGHAPLLFAMSAAVGQHPSEGVESGGLGPHTASAPWALTDSNGTNSDPVVVASQEVAVAPKPQRGRPAKQPKAKTAAPTQALGDEIQNEGVAPRKRKSKAQSGATEVREEAELEQSPVAKAAGRKRAKATPKTEEQAADGPPAEKKKRVRGVKAAGGFDSLRTMRKPRRSAREKKSVVAPVLTLVKKTPKQPLTAAMSTAAVAKAEQERRTRRNAWWCSSETKPATSQTDRSAGPEGPWQPKAPSSFMRRPKIIGHFDPLLPPATDSEGEEGDRDGGWTSKPSANDAQIKEKTLFNYTLCHFKLRQLMSKHLTDSEMQDCEKSLLLVLEHNMEIQLQLDYRDLWYLEETYVRQAAAHGKFLEGMLLPGLVLNRGGVIMYTTETFCDLVQRSPQDVLMCSALEFVASDNIYDFVQVAVGLLYAPGNPHNVVFDCKFRRQDSREEVAGRTSMKVSHDIYGLVSVLTCMIMPYTFQPDHATHVDTIFDDIKFL